MGKIFYLMGKSASGKDSIYKRLRSVYPELKSIVLYTTRPIRAGEQEGVEYYFIDDARLKKLEQSGRVIEVRTYQTVFGPWSSERGSFLLFFPELHFPDLQNRPNRL